MAEFQSSTHEQSSSLSQADTPIRRVHDYYEFAEVLGELVTWVSLSCAKH